MSYVLDNVKMKISTSLFLLALVALCSTETLDLGDLQQYHAKSVRQIRKPHGD